METVDIVIVGGGQAGLALSHCLSRVGREHLVLEQAAQPGHVWRNQRWDSFTLVTPNWMTRLPDAPSSSLDPDGFLPRDELVAYLERYAATQPVRYGVRVVAVEPNPDGVGHLVRAEAGGEPHVFAARHVVIATGLYQRAKVPAFAAELPADIAQMPSGDYRNPAALPAGAVVVMGAAQTGGQIAEELREAGREVYLCAGFAPRTPRRYRGHDILHWMALTRFFDQTADTLPSPQARFGANPSLTGKNGGHQLHLRQFARDGITVLGRANGARGADMRTLTFAPGLNETLTRIDNFEAETCAKLDVFIQRAAPDAPPPDYTPLPAEPLEERAELDLRAAGVSVIIWALGYTFDFSLAREAPLDDVGYPLQNRGVTSVPGLYFLGLPWLRNRGSGLLYGVGEDAEWLASYIATAR